MTERAGVQGARRHSLRARILLALASLAISLALLEAGLWAAGAMLGGRDDPGPDAVAGAGGPVRILCLGDSFTWGGREGVRYPSVLQGLLDARHGPGRFQVFNQGYCETNTSELLRFLPKVVAMHRPDIAVVLVGSANLFNPWDFDLYANRGPWTSFKSWVMNRRLVKMVRFIRLSLMLARDRGLPTPENDLCHDRDDECIARHFGRLDQPGPHNEHCLDARLAFREFRRSEEDVGRDAVPADDTTVLHGLLMAWGGADRIQDPRLDAQGWFLTHLLRGDDARAEALAAELEALDFDRYRGCVADAYFEAGRHRMPEQPDTAVALFLRAVTSDPDMDDGYYWLAKAFEQQSRFTATEVSVGLEAVAAKWGPKPSRYLKDYIRVFEQKQDWDAKVARWVRADLVAIVDLLHAEGVRVVLQNYPRTYSIANEALAETARRFSLPFVDNHSDFLHLETHRYILDDDHCTDLGYERMARNVFDVLAKSGLIGREGVEDADGGRLPIPD